jgi:adenosylcobinamide-GDP ribazoletransferase
LPPQRAKYPPMQSFLVALSFLTVLPVGVRKLPSPEVVARSRFWFPLVGVILGVLVGGLTALLSPLDQGALLKAFLVLLAWVLITGAIHLDGFCDLCDGLFGGQTQEERLRIMKDPHLGTFGVAGAILLLLGKLVVLSELISRKQEETAWIIGGAVAASRCLVLIVAAAAHYPREEGTGKVLIQATGSAEAVIFAALGAGLTCLVTYPELALALGTFTAATLTVLGLRLLCNQRLGGITGDCLGACIETAELTLLWVAALL